jgi:uncharacterized protein YjdB
MKWLKILALVSILAIAFVACGGGAKSMELSPASVKLDQKGATATLMPQFKDANGKVVEFKKTVTWTSSDEKVAKVAPSGIVTAEDSGTATITASGGEQLTATAKVTVQIPKSIQIMPTELDLVVGDKKALTAKVLDTAGKEIMGKPIDWKTDKATVATVVGGKVIGNGEGTAVVTATWSTLSATATVKVAKAAPEPAKPASVGKKNAPAKAPPAAGVGKKTKK